MKPVSLISALVVALLLIGSASQQSVAEEPKRVTVTFYHTADIHEHSALLPRIAGFVEARKKEDPNVLLMVLGIGYAGIMQSERTGTARHFGNCIKPAEVLYRIQKYGFMLQM